ncbi:MAG: hypothetical protein RLZZ33_620 [Pseudomonadota bacterium]|jgi:flagellar FliJ protein
MKREQRIAHYRHTLEKAERDCAALVQSADQRLTAAETQLHDLQRYRAEYQAGLGVRVLQGISGVALLDFHAFVARLGEAIRQQGELVQRYRRERDQATQRLQEAAVQHRTVGAVVERWRSEERLIEARQEQQSTDEQGQLAYLRQRISAA